MNPHEIAAILNLGVSYPDVVTMQKLSRSLRSWHERLCSDTQEDDNGRCWRFRNGKDHVRTPNRGPGLERRISAIVAEYQTLHHYIQTDPRGPALYVSGQPINEDNYSNGVAVY